MVASVRLALLLRTSRASHYVVLKTRSLEARRYVIGHSNSAPPGGQLRMRPVAVLPTDNFAVLPDEQWRAYSRRASLPSRVGRRLPLAGSRRRLCSHVPHAPLQPE